MKKRAKRKPKKTNRLSNLNIVPLSMGMMILRHFDNDPDDDNSDESETEVRARRRHYRGSEEDQEDMENEDKMPDLTKEQQDSAEKEDLSEPEPTGANDLSEVTETEEIAVENELKIEKQANQDEAKMAVDTDAKAEKVEDVTEIVESGKSLDIAMAGETSCDKDNNVRSKSEDSESDYGSADELPDVDDKTDTASAGPNAGFDIERILAMNIQRVRDRIHSELGALAPPDTNEEAEVNPPDAPSFDSDDEDDDMQMDFLEGLKRRANNSCPPRKLRYSSNTSVDTSTTSGIGSYTEDHLEAEMASHIDSQKTTPGTVSMDGPDTGKLCSKQQLMDYSDNEEAEDEDSDEKEEDSLPKESLGKLLYEKVELLPLPTALRSYVMYYRN